MGAAMAGAVVLAWLVALSVYDIRDRRLPNWLTLPGALVVVVGAMVAGRGSAALLGACGLAGVYLAVHLVAPAGMGAGDVKLAAAVGALAGAFGYEVWVLAAIAAPLITGVLAIAFVATSAKKDVPHGPSMCVATVAAISLAIL